MRVVSLVAAMLMTAGLPACRKPPEQPAAVPPIAMAEPPRLTDRLPTGASAPPSPASGSTQTRARHPDLVLAQSARFRLRQAFGTLGAPLLEVTVRRGVVTVTARPGNTATRPQVRAALAGLAGISRVDLGTLPP